MKLAKLFADGKELRLDKSIGKGGEGEVFAIANMPGFAIKAYLPRVVTEREKKIRAMVGTKLADSVPMVAFPIQIVVDGRGAFVGFVMRRVEKHKEIHELQTPSSRQQNFPKADYSFIVRVALNIARVFARVHATGCVIGDINQRSILVSSDATVAFIDADSFQVNGGAERYLCVVGVPEYTPPELQGKSLKSAVRTTDNDAFGLAVSLFQLLCMDRHPFSGRYSGSGDMPLEKAIAEYRFAYSARNTGMTPPPGTVRLSDFTPRVAQLFEEAFSPAHLGRRPSATQWVEALTELESSLRSCSRSKLHRYAREAVECPWCRMENEYGRPLFIDTDLGSIQIAKGRLDPTQGFVLDLASLMTAISGVAIPPAISVAVPKLPNTPLPSQEAKDALSKRRLAPLWKIGGWGTLIAGAFVFMAGIKQQGSGVLAAMIAAVGIWMFFRSASSVEGLVSAYQRAVRAVEARITHLQSTSPIDLVVRRKAEALDAIEESKELATAYASVRNDYDKHRRQKQMDDHLSRSAIRGARIAKLTSGDIAALASYGCTTAFDARRRDVQQVQGIGPVKGGNIMAWVRRVEAQFQFQTAYTPSDLIHIRQAQGKIVTQQQGLDERIRKAIDAFRHEAQAFERWKLTPDSELLRLTQQLAQAEADLLHLGEAVPAKPHVAPTSVPGIASFQRRAPTTKPGFAFGGTQTGPSGGPIASPRQARAPKLSAKPTCPNCRSRMVLRTAHRGQNAGNNFWGCSRFPSCTGTRPV
jgi:DNA-binding helix-hairpin-helix protein with protein kinase domain